MQININCFHKAVSSTRYPKFSSFDYSSACISRTSHIRYMTYPSNPTLCDILRSVRGIMFYTVHFCTPSPDYSPSYDKNGVPSNIFSNLPNLYSTPSVKNKFHTDVIQHLDEESAYLKLHIYSDQKGNLRVIKRIDS